MNHAAAALIPAMFLVHVIVAIAIAPDIPRHRRSKTRTRRGRP